MKHSSLFFKITVLFFVIFISCKSAEVTQQEQPPIGEEKHIHQKVIELIVNIPAENDVEEPWVNEQLTELGPDAIQSLSKMLATSSAGGDLKPRYAMNSLANYVTRSGAVAEKRAFEQAILSELRNDYSEDVKTFLFKQLRLTASNSSVPVLEHFLSDEKLYNEALRVLLIIDSPAAATAVRNALSGADVSQQIAFVKALGELQDQQAAEAILQLTNSDTYPLQRMALFSLSEIGEPGASSAFEEAISEFGGFERSEIISFYIRYAGSLQAKGYSSESERITNDVIDGNFAPYVKSSALTVRFKAEGESLTEELVQFAENSHEILARTSLKLLNTLQGDDITDYLIRLLETAAESNKRYVIEAMADRGDPASISALKSHAEQSGGETGVYALGAVFQIEGSIEPDLIMNLLDQATSDSEIIQLEALLKQLEPNVVLPAAAAAIPDISTRGKPVLIRLLTKYRAAEYKPAVINLWNGSSPELRESIFQYLAQTGDSKELEVVLDWSVEQLSDENSNLAAEAVAAIFYRSYPESERNKEFRHLYEQATIQQRRVLTYAAPQIEGIKLVDIINNSFSSDDTDLQSAAVDVLSSRNRSEFLPLLTRAIRSVSEEDASRLMDNYLQVLERSDEPFDEKSEKIEALFADLEDRNMKIVLLRKMNNINEVVALRVLRNKLNVDPEIADVAVAAMVNIFEPYLTLNQNGSLTLPTAYMAALSSEDLKTVREAIVRQEDPQKVREDKNLASHFGPAFNGTNLDGWQVIGNEEAWGVEDGLLYTDGAGSGWISTENQYDDFIVELEFQVPKGGNSGLFIRAPHEGNPAAEGLEIQILDDYADRYADLQPWQFTGSIYFEQAVSKRVTKSFGEWQSMKVHAEGSKIKVLLNGELVINTDLIRYMDNAPNHPGLLKRKGYIGLQNHGDRVYFRNISISQIE